MLKYSSSTEVDDVTLNLLLSVRVELDGGVGGDRTPRLKRSGEAVVLFASDDAAL